MFKKLLIVSAIFLILALAGFIWANNSYNSAGNYTDTKHIIIEKGSGTASILNQLSAAGAIKHPTLLRVVARMKGLKNLRYGEYLLEPHLSPKQIFERLHKGEVVVRKITVTEGKTVYDVVELLTKAEGLTGEIPQDIKEGSLMPQTYYYQWGDSYKSIIKQMQNQMAENLKRMWEFRRMDIPLTTPEQALILASIVEKETGNADERPLVASVFTNRLKTHMPLQSDPTAVYGITAGAPLGHLPTGADMKSQNPYNTYIIPALPPGPICNPGIATIEAVLNPADTSYIFFVANGQGGHNFSSGLAEHNKNVNVYRKARKAIVANSVKSKEARQKSGMIIKP